MGGRGLIETGGLFEKGGGLFNLEETINGVSSPQRTRIQSGKAQVQEGWR